MSESNPQPKPVEAVAEQPVQPAVAAPQPAEHPAPAEIDAAITKLAAASEQLVSNTEHLHDLEVIGAKVDALQSQVNAIDATTAQIAPPKTEEVKLMEAPQIEAVLEPAPAALAVPAPVAVVEVPAPRQQYVISGAGRIIAFRNVMETVKAITDEIYLTPDGVLVAGMPKFVDNGILNTKAAGEWDIAKIVERNTLTTPVGINTNDLFDFLKPLKRGKKEPGLLELTLTKGEKFLVASIDGDKKMAKLPVIDQIDASKLPTPQSFEVIHGATYPVVAIVEASGISDALNQGKKLGGIVQIRVSGTSLRLLAEGENGPWNESFAASTGIEKDAPDMAENSYSVDYLKNILVAAKLDPAVQFRLGAGLLSLVFAIHEVGKGKDKLGPVIGKATYWLAAEGEE